MLKLGTDRSKCKFCDTLLNNETQFASDIKSGSLMCKFCRMNSRKKNATPDKVKIYTKTNKDKVKAEVFDKLGSSCQCCGIDDLIYLSVDHINNDGASERKLSGGTNRRAGIGTIYATLKANDFDTTQYRIQCFSCNMSRGFHGYCQHNIVQSDYCHFCKTLLIDNQFQFHISGNISICKSCTMGIRGNTMELWKKNQLFEIRRKLIEGYGGKCAYCFDSHWCFLSIDHVNNDGKKHRKQYKSNPYGMYREIINTNFPSQFQLLCYNCNGAKEIKRVSAVSETTIRPEPIL